MSITGSQTPNKSTSYMPKFHHTDGGDAAWLAGKYGLTPDPWQALFLDHLYGRNAKDEPTCTQGCLSVPRQAGKSAILDMLELFELVILGRKILHTAHQVRTSRNSFLRLAAFFENTEYPELIAMVKRVRRTNGQEAIYLTNGGEISFSARSQNAARGLTVDTLVMDEAQDLGDETLAALLPTISAAPTGEPRQVIAGTPPTTKSDGEVWTRLRESAQARKNRKAMWAEWSADDSAGPVDLSDEKVWAAANPALGYRLMPSVIADELAAMEPGVFMRERLGMWNLGKGQSAAIPEQDWEACAAQGARVTEDDIERITLAVDLSPNRDSGSIAAAITTTDGHPIIDVIDQRTGDPSWIAPRVAQIVERQGAAAVVIDSYSPAASLIPEIERRGVGVTKANVGTVTSSAERLMDAVVTHQVRHLNQPSMQVAVAGAVRRAVGKEGRFSFGRMNSATDISPLVAAMLAFGALGEHDADLTDVRYRKKKRKGAPKKNYTRRVVVM